MAFGDYQMQIYLAGVEGRPPQYPMTAAGWEDRAKGALPEDVWSYLAGGAGDEQTQRANVAAFREWALVPRMLRAGDRDLSTELLGMRLPTPLLMAPIGVLGICAADGHGDLSAARTAAETGIPMIASTLSTDPLEAVAAELGDTPGLFQLYTPTDRDLATSLVQRAERAGYRAIVVTLDTWTLGWRPRDLALGSFPQLRGACLMNYLTDPVFRSSLPVPPEQDPRTAVMAWTRVFGGALTWDDLTWLRSLTSLPLVLKGLCHPDDVRRARDAGVDGIYCSTHGGRQANGGWTALDALPEVVQAAGDLPVIVDSGVRSGTDVVKALALGAAAVGIGRPVAHGIAMGGTEGAAHVLRCLLAEADLLMAVDGYRSIAELAGAGLRRVPLR